MESVLFRAKNGNCRVCGQHHDCLSQRERKEKGMKRKKGRKKEPESLYLGTMGTFFSV
jgi:hypothetical protein